jgi:hypothetical protein
LIAAIVAVLGLAVVWMTGGDSQQPTVPPECTEGAVGDYVVRSDASGLFFDC